MIFFQEHWKGLLIFIAIAGLLVYAVMSVPTLFTTPKVGKLIDDSNLRDALAQTVGEPVKADKLEKVTVLDLSDSKIEELSGMQYCSLLVSLDLSGNRIDNIAPLDRCLSLRELNLNNNRIDDRYGIDSLHETPFIEILDLSSNEIVDITILTYMRHLSELNLADNRIVNLEPLVYNPGLSEGDIVNVENNPLSEESINVYIPQLQKRGVIVKW